MSMVPQFDVYTDDIKEDFDVIFTNPPFKNKAQFLDAMYKYYEKGKGFCVLLPFESDSQADFFDAIKEKFSKNAIIKNTMAYIIYFKKNSEKVKPVGKCSWFVGGSSITLPEKKSISSYCFTEGEEP